MPRMKARAINTAEYIKNETALVHDRLYEPIATNSQSPASPQTLPPRFITSHLCMRAFLSRKNFPPNDVIRAIGWSDALIAAATSVENANPTMPATNSDADSTPPDQRWYNASLLLRERPRLGAGNHYQMYSLPGLDGVVFDTVPHLEQLCERSSSSAEKYADMDHSKQAIPHPVLTPHVSTFFSKYGPPVHSPPTTRASMAHHFASRTPNIDITAAETPLNPIVPREPALPIELSTVAVIKRRPGRPVGSKNRKSGSTPAVHQYSARSTINAPPTSLEAFTEKQKRKKLSPGLELTSGDTTAFSVARPKRVKLAIPNYLDQSSSPLLSASSVMVEPSSATGKRKVGKSKVAYVAEAASGHPTANAQTSKGPRRGRKGARVGDDKTNNTAGSRRTVSLGPAHGPDMNELPGKPLSSKSRRTGSVGLFGGKNVILPRFNRGTTTNSRELSVGVSSELDDIPLALAAEYLINSSGDGPILDIEQVKKMVDKAKTKSDSTSGLDTTVHSKLEDMIGSSSLSSIDSNASQSSPSRFAALPSSTTLATTISESASIGIEEYMVWHDVAASYARIMPTQITSSSGSGVAISDDDNVDVRISASKSAGNQFLVSTDGEVDVTSIDDNEEVGNSSNDAEGSIDMEMSGDTGLGENVDIEIEIEIED